MRTTLKTRAPAAAGVVVGALVVTAGVAIAATSLVVDTTDVKLRVLQSEFADGFDSGWHTHPGLVVVQVQEGYFKFYQGSCQPVVVQKGETFVEVPLVPVRGVATGPVKWTTTQVLPAAQPPSTPAASPCP